MPTLSSGADKLRQLATASAFLCLSLMLSFAESILFPTGLLPIAGAKLGLANAAVLLCASVMGRRYGAAVSFSRVLLTFVLFGNATSALYSFSGALLSFIGIALCNSSRKLSFFGKSIISAVLHNTAQVICAVVLLGLPAAALLGWMLLVGLLCGGFTGILLNLSYGTVIKSTSLLTRHENQYTHIK